MGGVNGGVDEVETPAIRFNGAVKVSPPLDNHFLPQFLRCAIIYEF